MGRSIPKLLALSMLLSLVGGCADRTALRLVIRSNLAVPAEMDSVLIVVRSSTGASVPPRAVPLAGTAFPQTLVVRPEPSGASGTVTFTVQGLREGVIVIQRVVRAAFRPGQVVDVEVALDSDCLGVECGPDIDCLRGMCTDASPDAGMPDAGGRDVGSPLDAFLAPDAGSADAGEFDANSADSGSSDASEFDAPWMDAVLTPDAISLDAHREPDAFNAADAHVEPVRDLLINEVDYDQPGTDTAEFVEIVNTGSAPIDIGRFQLLLFNGASMPAMTYAPSPIALSGTLMPGQRLVVASPGLTEVDPEALVVRLRSDSVIQNGDPDGLCVWDTLRLECVTSLAYGLAPMGTFTATYMGRMFSLVSGTPTSARDSSTAMRSLCRSPDLVNTGNDATDWAQCSRPTPGAPNLP